MRLRAWALVGVAAALLSGCWGGGGEKSGQATATAPGTATASASPSPASTPPGTPATTPSRTATVVVTSTATPGRVDGTVAPQNPGSTEPVTVKANPDPPGRQALLTDVRVGSHPEEGGWDRIVFQFRDVRPPGVVAYTSAVAACGSGQPVRVAGQSLIAVRFTGVDAHTQAGQLSIPSTTLAGPGGAIVEARQFCDFEGHVDWAIGITGVKRYKVTLLEAPARVVIDVKW